MNKKVYRTPVSTYTEIAATDIICASIGGTNSTDGEAPEVVPGETGAEGSIKERDPYASAYGNLW